MTGWHPTLSPSSFLSFSAAHFLHFLPVFSVFNSPRHSLLYFAPFKITFPPLFLLSFSPLSLSSLTKIPFFLSLPPFPSLSCFVSLLLSVVPHTGQVVLHPERLITFLPPAVYTSVLAAKPIHYLPWSRAAHTSPLSATTSFSVWTPSCGRAWLLSKTLFAINQEEDRVQMCSLESNLRNHLLFVLFSTCRVVSLLTFSYLLNIIFP